MYAKVHLYFWAPLYECAEASFLSLKSTVFMRFDAIFKFQKCAETSSSFRTYRVDPYNHTLPFTSFPFLGLLS